MHMRFFRSGDESRGSCIFSDRIYLSDRLSSVSLATVNTLEIRLAGLTEPPAQGTRQVRRNKQTNFGSFVTWNTFLTKGRESYSHRKRTVFQNIKTPVCLYCRPQSKHANVMYDPLRSSSHHCRPGCRCSLLYISNPL